MITGETFRVFRNNFLLSQLDAAALLNTTRSQLAMMEKGLRAIPVDIAIKLLELLHRIEENRVRKNSLQTTKTLDDSAEETAFIKGLHNQLATLQFDQEEANNQLAKMREEDQQLKGGIEKLEHLLDVLEEESDQAFIRQKQRQYIKKLSGCGRIAQFDLQVKIALLLAKAAVISGYIDETENVSVSSAQVS